MNSYVISFSSFCAFYFYYFFFFYSRLFSVEPILVWRLTNISFCSAIRSVLMVLESFYETFFLHFYFLQNEMRLNEINETDRCAQKLLRFFDIKSIENGMSNGLIFVPLLWQNEVKKKYILVTLCYVHRRWFLFPLSYRSYVFYTTFSLLAFKPNWQRECEAERQRENEQEKTKKKIVRLTNKRIAHTNYDEQIWRRKILFCPNLFICFASKDEQKK